jgi:hypothetical protein
MSKLIISILFIFAISATQAQRNASIRGTVFDTLSKKGLSYATVSLVAAKDSTLIGFTRADSSGNFHLTKIAAGKYLLSTSYVGYVPVWKSITVIEGEDLLVGKIPLVDFANASSVTVTAKRPPVVMNNDTLEFNTENFRTQPNAVVEDLLKKLPGVTIDADGTVKVNGQTVNRVLVNGKEFFTGDPKMATKNLNADAVDKVQVFDKKTDQAEFTGIDDGNSQKAINLKLKKDKDNALFGRVTAGAGNNERYDAQANINKFKGDQQISFLGMANNTNRQGFSIGDVLNFTGEHNKGMRNGGGVTIRISGNGPNNAGLPTTGLGQNQQGIATAVAGGVNYNDSWNKKTDFNTSGSASDIHLLTDKTTNRQYILPGNSYNYDASSNSIRDIKQQKVNMSYDHKIDSFSSIKIVPVVTSQQQNNWSNSNYVSQNLNNIKLNEGYNNSFAKSNALDLSNSVLYRLRFRKKGRTISASVNMNYNHSEQNGTLDAKNSFFTGNTHVDSILNQSNHYDGVTNNYGGNITYTEPLGKRSLIEISSFINSNVGESDKKTYDYNTASGKHDLINNLLSNNFKSNYTYTGASLNIRSNQKKLNYTVGASIQSANLKSINQTYSTTVQQSFTDLLPIANFQYKFSNYRNVRIDYSTSTQQPSTTQLQPIQNVSDPLNVFQGNPDLKRAYTHTINMNYFSADPFTRKNFFVFLAAGKTINAIVNADSTNANGSRKTTFTNANGVSYLFGNASIGFPIKKLKSIVDLSFGASYNHNVSFINGAINAIDNLSLTPSINWNFGIDNVIDIQTGAGLSISEAQYSLQSQSNSNYLTQRYSTEIINYLPWGIVLNNNFKYTINSGRADGYNTEVPLWNVSVAKSFMKNKRAEVKLSVFDLLNKNIGSNRSANQNYIEDVKYNVLQRYFQLSFTYILNKAGKTAGGPNIQIRSFGNDN